MTVDGNTAREALDSTSMARLTRARPGALAAVARLEAENGRLREALTYIANARPISDDSATRGACFVRVRGEARAALGLEGSEPDGRAEAEIGGTA